MFDAAVRDRQVGHAEMMDAQRAEAGLSQLQQDVEGGLISKEEAADAAYFLRTKTDRVRQRVEAQHAQMFKEQAEQRAQMIAAETQNAENAKAFQVQAGLLGHTIKPFTDPNTGKQHWLAVDDKGKFYNPLLEHATKEADTKEFTNKAGGFDRAAALKDAKSFAEENLGPRPKLTKDSTPDDKAAQATWDDLVSRRVQGLERLSRYPGKTEQDRQAAEHNAQNSQSDNSAPPNTPGQDAQARNDQRELPPEATTQLPKATDAEKQKVDSLPVSNLKKTILKGYLDQAAEIAAKPYKTDEDKKNYATLRRLYEEQSR